VKAVIIFNQITLAKCVLIKIAYNAPPLLAFYVSQVSTLMELLALNALVIILDVLCVTLQSVSNAKLDIT
jgi:hypothetical protein